MKVFNYKIWRGVAAILVLVFSIAMFISFLAFNRPGDINNILGITVPGVDPEKITDDTNYFPSSYERTAAGREALRADIRTHNIRAQEESSVLVKNANNALPLTAGERNVTLFGLAAAKPVYKPNGGGPGNSGVNFNTALTDAGFRVNPTVLGVLTPSSTGATDVKGKIPEVPVSVYSGTESSYASDYNDAAIIVFSRFGGEEADLNPEMAAADGGGSQLALHQNEKAVLNLVKNSNKFGKIIVLINSNFAMELGWLDEYNVDACLVVGFIGGDGAHGIANILKGDADPSGSFADAWAADSLSAPAVRNYGHFRMGNNTLGLYKNTYVVYAEGIYLGYKYYETRYQDQVLNVNNAKATKGAYASTGGWDYAAEMAYPFGYGISYANFTQELVSLDWNRTTHKVTASVKVTNNGAPSVSAYTGKSNSAIQLYVQLPYAAGQAEKSAIQLIDFEKSSMLAKNESETVEFEFDDYIFATYDENATNGADTSKKGCYVFDQGDYFFSVGFDAHDALNNVLAARGATGMFSHNGTPVTGNAAKTKKISLAALDNMSHARSIQTGEIVRNQFKGTRESSDINDFISSKITYMTRSNWNTYPDPLTGINATDEMLRQMKSEVYEMPSNAPKVSSFKSEQDNGINFVSMRNVDFNDDITWNLFLDQLSLADLCNIPGETMANVAIPKVAYPANSNGDGPNGLMSGGLLYISEATIAQSFNKKLLAERGSLMGEESQRVPYGTLYAPGANLHRTQFGGRNGEYYSEDPILSYICGAVQVKAMKDKGLITAIKHFAGNDQEVNRHGVATFMTEQTWREGGLKGFEGAFTLGESLGTMTSFSRIGCTPAASHYATMTQVLRKEWGFKGINMTDSSKDSASYLLTAEAIAAGTTQFNNDPSRSNEIRGTLIGKNDDGYIYSKLREMAKHFFYAYTQSHFTNGLDAQSIIVPFVPWWQPTLIAICVTFGVLMAGAAVMFALSAYVFKKKPKEVIA